MVDWSTAEHSWPTYIYPFRTFQKFVLTWTMLGRRLPRTPRFSLTINQELPQL